MQDVVIEVKDLALVQAVVEHGTLSAAARHMKLSQPALSRQLAEAERRLGAILFTRQGRRLRLAPAGQRLLAAAQEVLPLLTRAGQELGSVVSQPSGPSARIIAANPHAYRWLLPLLTAQRRQGQPGTLQLEFLGHENAIQSLRAGQTDILVDLGSFTAPDLRAVRLFEEEVFAYLTPQHPAARQPFLPARDFANLDLLTDGPFTEQLPLANLLQKQGVTPKRVVNVALTAGALELAAHGFGVACAFRAAAVTAIQKPVRLAELKITARGLIATWRALSLNSRPELAPLIQGLARACQP